jgi:precorrin-6A/cobalt-precorrin-6A reductase
MAEPRRLLILGGTTEGVALAARAATVAGLTVVSSLAGRTRNPRRPEGALRVGGFGGADGLQGYLRDAGIDLVVDATHPFAATITANAVAACAAADRPLLALRRPEWSRAPDDEWIEVDSVAEAAACAAAHGRRVFVTVGGGELGIFADRPGPWLLARVMETGGAPKDLANGIVVTARGPFAIEDEIALMTEHRIDCLVTKNAGGQATYAKIAAARSLGLPVVMVRRPPLPESECVETVDAAIDWLRARIA